MPAITISKDLLRLTGADWRIATDFEVNKEILAHLCGLLTNWKLEEGEKAEPDQVRIDALDKECSRLGEELATMHWSDTELMARVKYIYGPITGALYAAVKNGVIKK